MSLFWIILLLLFFPFILHFLFLKKSLFASDEALHILFIDQIKKNKHKFIKHCNAFLIQSKMTYPQLIHWMFSFFSKSWINKISRFTPMIFSIGSLLFFFFFALKSYYCFSDLNISKEEFLVLAGLLFVTTPFNYNINNAKNGGISARGFGLMLGQIYTYGLVLYILLGSGHYLFVSGAVALLILMSSQFAAQYILFSTILLMPFYSSLVIIIPLISSLVLFFLIMPQIAWQFFSGNLGHKKFYYKYLAKSFILAYRASIWKDVFYEIWRLIFTKSKPKGGGTLFMYIYTNPIVILLFSLPLTLPIFFYFLYKIIQAGALQDDLIMILNVPIIVSLILFIFFSFNKTRFLGEPERYAEFTLGFMAVIITFLLRNHLYVLHTIILFQILFVLFQAYISRLRFKVKTKNIYQGLLHINTKINQNNSKDENIRILSNNTEIMRMLTDSERQVFYGSLYSEWYGKFHYTELYINYLELKGNMILPVIEEFKINYFVLDINRLPISQFNAIINSTSIRFRQIAEVDNLVAYKIC